MIENHLDRHAEIGVLNNLEFKQGYPTDVNASVRDDNKSEIIKQEEKRIFRHLLKRMDPN